ncbi:MAG TPA: LuxR C-terminal-related transcriptional regulator [Telluria sp.]|jgi:transcriptional regulator EpsA
MASPVILSANEQDYLLRIVESAVGIRTARDFYLWSQGQLQALLPHTLLIGMQFDAGGAVQTIEAVHAALLAPALVAHLCDLAPRLTRHHPCARALAVSLDWPEQAPPALQALLQDSGFADMLVHGSGAAAGGSSMFVLFGPSGTANARTGHFLSILLPQMHLALSRLTLAASRAAPLARGLSARELQILNYLRDGKKNAEIAALLGISALTVKNHLQRIYPLLGARNRTAAVARGNALQLLAIQ